MKNPPDFVRLFIRQLLTDFGDGLSFSIGVKGEKGGQNENRALLLKHSCGARDCWSEDLGSNIVGPSIRDKEWHPARFAPKIFS